MISRQNPYQNSRNYSSCRTLPSVPAAVMKVQSSSGIDNSSSQNSFVEKSVKEEFEEMIEPSFFDHKFKKPLKKLRDPKKDVIVLGRTSSLLLKHPQATKSRNQPLKQSNSVAQYASVGRISVQ